MHHPFLKKLPKTLWGIPFLLCACSTTSETFDCKAGKGVGCQPISAINKMVDQGILGKTMEEGKESMLPSSAPMISNIESFGNQSQAPLSDDFFVHRTSEEPLRVWIAPFQDVQGNFHEGSVIHTVLKPGVWRLGLKEFP